MSRQFGKGLHDGARRERDRIVKLVLGDDSEYAVMRQIAERIRDMAPDIYGDDEKHMCFRVLLMLAVLDEGEVRHLSARVHERLEFLVDSSARPNDSV